MLVRTTKKSLQCHQTLSLTEGVVWGQAHTCTCKPLFCHDVSELNTVRKACGFVPVLLIFLLDFR